MTTTTTAEVGAIVDLIRTSRRFVLSSHARPDGDSIGSQLAMAYALRSLGKEVHVVNKDLAPPPLQVFPGVQDIEIASRVTGEFDAAIIMECGDLARTGVEGLDRFFVVNIDHHPGNSAFGRINWFDASSAACAEMVFDLIKVLGAPITVEVATHVYLAILTDTGSFHYSSISPRTFDICRQLLETGIDPVQISRNVYDTSTLGRVRLFGAVLHGMEIAAGGRTAVLYLDRAIAQAAGGTHDDTDGLINMPLTVKEIQTVVFFKHGEGDDYRVSMRSKGNVDIGVIAKEFGGGGHKNAAGCTVHGTLETLKPLFVAKIERAMALAEGTP